MIFDRNVDDWCLFLKKLDQMNVYENWSTVPDDVKKWSNECDAAIELWAGKLLMSEMLHSIVKRSDALTRLFWCQNCCTRSWNNQMRWRLSDCQNCIWCRCHQMHWQLFRCQAALHPTSSRSNKKLLMFKLLHLIAMKLNALTIVWLSELHLMSMSSDALAVVWLSDCCIWSWNNRMHADNCLFDANQAFDVCWYCRLTDWLQNKLLTDDANWTSDVRFHWLRMIFFIHRRYFFRFFWRFSSCKCRISLIWLFL